MEKWCTYKGEGYEAGSGYGKGEERSMYEKENNKVEEDVKAEAWALEEDVEKEITTAARIKNENKTLRSLNKLNGKTSRLESAKEEK